MSGTVATRNLHPDNAPMCYSAQIRSEYRQFVRMFGGELSLRAFSKLYFERQSDPKIKIPKSIDSMFQSPQTDEEREIKGLIDAFNKEQSTKLEQELFKQRKRLADAERTLQTKVTKKATDDQRIATDKIQWALGKLGDLNRVEPKERDARIFPGVYAPVMIWEDGKRVVKPMRYQCRPPGKPAFYDSKFGGSYNARKDNLESTFWRGTFGIAHGILCVTAFYENVDRGGENAVLEFRPEPAQDMLVACLWSHWTPPKGSDEPELLSFAAITDEPPPEVAAAGHDRCIVPIRPENVDAWLRPDRNNLAAQYAILDDRARPYYEHRLAA
jgi:putative SOS response-associated peptidase YedK